MLVLLNAYVKGCRCRRGGCTLGTPPQEPRCVSCSLRWRQVPSPLEPPAVELPHEKADEAEAQPPEDLVAVAASAVRVVSAGGQVD